MRFASRFSLLASLVLGVVCLPPLAARAQTTFFPSNTTINSVNPVAGSAVVGYANQNDFNNRTNRTSPTVSLGSGGSVSVDLYAYNSSIVNHSGGGVGGNLFAQDSSTVNNSGGSFGNSLVAYDSSTLNLFGTGLTALLVNANYGNLSQYSLSGTLSNGTILVNKTLYVQNGSTARFTLNPAVTPEPGSIALLVGLTTTGAGFLSRRRRQQAHNAM